MGSLKSSHFKFASQKLRFGHSVLLNKRIKLLTSGKQKFKTTSKMATNPILHVWILTRFQVEFQDATTNGSETVFIGNS